MLVLSPPNTTEMILSPHKGVFCRRGSVATASSPIKSRRRVAFACDGDNKNDENKSAERQLNSACEAFDEETKRALWYQRDELRHFQQEISRVVQTREHNNKTGNGQLSGLERYTPDRMSYKKRAVQYILLAQRAIREEVESKSKSDAATTAATELLSNVSRKLSVFATAAAREDALSMFGQAASTYDEAEDAYRTLSKRKHAQSGPSSCGDDNSRRVRARRASCVTDVRATATPVISI